MKVNTEENGNPELLFYTVNTYPQYKGFYVLVLLFMWQARQAG
jgi:hypothetical protein